MTQLFGLLAHELWSLPPPPFIPHLSHTYPTLTPRFLSLSTDKGSGSRREAGEGPGPRAWPPRGGGVSLAEPSLQGVCGHPPAPPTALVPWLLYPVLIPVGGTGHSFLPQGSGLLAGGDGSRHPGQMSPQCSVRFNNLGIVSVI